MKNMAKAMLTIEPKAENRNLALVILSIESGNLLILLKLSIMTFFKKYTLRLWLSN